MSEPKKRIFIGLIVFTVLLITAITVGLYLIPYIGLRNIHPLAPTIVCWTMGSTLGLLLLGVGLLILTLVRGREVFLAARLRGIVIEVLFPIMIIVGRVLGISKMKVQQSFVEVNNLLVRARCAEVKP
jgi:voltage-gated potassium channel Kch